MPVRFTPRCMKAQSSMIMIILVLLVFAGVAMFLLSFAQQISQEDYMDLYVSNMWLTISRSDTGYRDANCRLVSDALACAYYLGNPRCGGTGPTCLEVANSTLSYYLERFSETKKNLRYFLKFESYTRNQSTFELEPEISLLESGIPLRLRLGDESLEDERARKWAVSESIIRGEHILRAQLVVALD
jgi:hypothetical protein